MVAKKLKPAPPALNSPSRILRNTDSLTERQRVGQTREAQTAFGFDHIWKRPIPPLIEDVVSAAGEPLDDTTRATLEPRFGHDFGKVRVHSDPKAAQAAEAVHARAFTVRNHIVMGAGQFAPATAAGQRLLAHELTHAMQQMHGLAHGIQRQDDEKPQVTPTRDEFIEEIMCGRGGVGLFGRSQVNELFRLSGTFFTNPPDLSGAEIEDLSTGKRDLYRVGSWLGDEWQIVEIELNQVRVVSATCGTEEVLGGQTEAPAKTAQAAPDRNVKVSKGTLGHGTVNIFNECKRVEFVPEDTSRPRRVYQFDDGMGEYVLEGDTNVTYTPLRLAQIVGVQLLDYENGKLHAKNCGIVRGMPR